MLVYLTCSSLFISRIKCPNTFYPAARGVNREDFVTVLKVSELMKHDSFTLQTKMYSQVTVDIFCFSFFSVMYTFLRWRSNPELSAPDEAVILLLRGQILFLCQAVTFTVESTGTDSLLELQLLQLFALCCGGASYCCRLSVLVEGFGIGF